MQRCWQALDPSPALRLPPEKWREVFLEEAEAVWEHTAPEVVPVRAQSGCWMSLQSETPQFKSLEGPQWGGKNQKRTQN